MSIDKGYLFNNQTGINGPSAAETCNSPTAETLLKVARRSREHFQNRCLLDAFLTDTYSYLVQAGIDIWMPSFSSQIQQISLLIFMIE